MSAFIAVHGGAGVHRINNEKEVKQALKKCAKFLTSLKPL